METDAERLEGAEAERANARSASPVGRGIKPPTSGRPNRGRMEGKALRVKLSPDERAAFEQIAARYEMTISDYIRSMALDPAALHADELKRILGKLAKISSRVNTVAKRINIDGGHAPLDLTLIRKEISEMHGAVLKAVERE